VPDLTKLKGKLTKDNFLIMALLGVLLLVIAWPAQKEEEESKSSLSDSESDMLDIQYNTGGGAGETGADGCVVSNYAAYLEDSLEQLLSTVDGVGQVQVMVTLEDGGEKIIEKDYTTSRQGTTEVDSAGGSRNTTDISEQESTVFVSDGNSDEPFIRQVKYPRVSGVVVSAEGGGNAQTVQKITRAIQALFGIEAHKIIIVKMISR